MISRSIQAEAKKIFEKLYQSKEYHNGFATAKCCIIANLFTLRDELRVFAKTPGRRSYEINGFFTEYCARFSNQLPRNTPKAQNISEAIINYLQSRKLCNPDHIWIKIQGKRITLTGIGEVKSHPLNMIRKPTQLFLQEKHVRNLIKYGYTNSAVFKHHRVILAKKFARYIILPRSIKAPHVLPASTPLGWEIKEIEFTFPEIIFLKNLLLDEVPLPDNPSQYILGYSPQKYQFFVGNIMTRIEKIIISFFQNLLPVHKKDIRNTLIVWNLLWNSLPTNSESINLITRWMHEVKQQHLCPLALLSAPPSSLTELDEKENASRNCLMRYATPDTALFAHALLSRLREVRQELPPPPIFSEKQDIEIFTLL